MGLFILTDKSAYIYNSEDSSPVQFIFAYPETETQIAWIEFEMYVLKLLRILLQYYKK